MKTTNKQTTPAPVWRLLEPGEIIREGDEYWHPVKGWRSPVWGSNGRPVETEQPVRRRIEPDPVKAELLAALEWCASCLSLEVKRLRADGKKVTAEGHARAISAARAAIARATT